jgi:hypothetical protein
MTCLELQVFFFLTSSYHVYLDSVHLGGIMTKGILPAHLDVGSCVLCHIVCKSQCVRTWRFLDVGSYALCHILCNSECVRTWPFGMLALMPCATFCVKANACALGAFTDLDFYVPVCIDALVNER